MRTTPLKGIYKPALKAAADLSPAFVAPNTATGRCDYLGITWTNGPKLYAWSPFIKNDPNTLVNLHTLVVKNADNERLSDVVESCRVTAEGITFELNASVLAGTAGAAYSISFEPDESWPKLDNIWEPGFSAIAFAFPAAWVTG